MPGRATTTGERSEQETPTPLKTEHREKCPQSPLKTAYSGEAARVRVSTVCPDKSTHERRTQHFSCCNLAGSRSTKHPGAPSTTVHTLLKLSPAAVGVCGRDREFGLENGGRHTLPSSPPPSLSAYINIRSNISIILLQSIYSKPAQSDA